MRKIILDLATTLDGFIEGPKGETDWCIMDDDMDFEGFLSSIDTIFYGRVSYERWGNFQPTSSEPDKSIWPIIHSKKKYVFSSRSIPNAKATFISSDLAKEVARIKQQQGKDIWLYGGAKLIGTLMDLNLVDIYRISIHPIVLGTGKPLFDHPKGTMSLELVDVNRFRSGVVQLIYNRQR